MSHCYVADETTDKAMNECREGVKTTVISLQFCIASVLQLIKVNQHVREYSKRCDGLL